MKRKFKVVIYIIILLICWACTGLGMYLRSKDIKNTKEVEIKPLTINTTTTGTLKVYAEGVEDFSYTGEIDIRNDGKNGEPIEIVVEVH